MKPIAGPIWKSGGPGGSKAAMGAARSGQVFGWVLFEVGAYPVLARRDYNWLWFIILGGA